MRFKRWEGWGLVLLVLLCCEGVFGFARERVDSRQRLSYGIEKQRQRYLTKKIELEKIGQKRSFKAVGASMDNRVLLLSAYEKGSFKKTENFFYLYELDLRRVLVYRVLFPKQEADLRKRLIKKYDLLTGTLSRFPFVREGVFHESLPYEIHFISRYKEGSSMENIFEVIIERSGRKYWGWELSFG